MEKHVLILSGNLYCTDARCAYRTFLAEVLSFEELLAVEPALNEILQNCGNKHACDTKAQITIKKTDNRIILLVESPSHLRNEQRITKAIHRAKMASAGRTFARNESGGMGLIIIARLSKNFYIRRNCLTVVFERKKQSESNTDSEGECKAHGELTP